jgi:hypothetical protein
MVSLQSGLDSSTSAPIPPRVLTLWAAASGQNLAAPADAKNAATGGEATTASRALETSEKRGRGWLTGLPPASSEAALPPCRSSPAAQATSTTLWLAEIAHVGF